MRFIDRTGEKFMTNEGYEIEVTECFSAINCTIKFNDWNSTILYNIPAQRLINGMIKNPYHPSVHGVGYFGIGEYKTSYKGKIQIKLYSVWSKMIARCYSVKSLIRNPSYKRVTVCSDWHCFQNFALWHEENFENYMKGWHIDKDIICKDCKIYSPKTCAFVPFEINMLFTNRKNDRGKYPVGVYKKGNRFRACISKNKVIENISMRDTPQEAFYDYKKVKEAYVKEIADKWKDLIDPRIYKGMYEFKVNIND